MLYLGVFILYYGSKMYGRNYENFIILLNHFKHHGMVRHCKGFLGEGSFINHVDS